jgi:hypothetical protein
MGFARHLRDVARGAGRQPVGPDIRSFDAAGNSSTLPSGVILGLFAVIGTWAVAKYGLGKTSHER